MSKVKYQVMSGKRVLYEAPSVARLLAMVKQDRDHWEEAGLLKDHSLEIGNVRAGYNGLLAELEKLSEKTPSYDCRQNRDDSFFPPSGSDIGILLKSTLGREEKHSLEAVLTYWWWVNGWTDIPSNTSRYFYANRNDLMAVRHGAAIVDGFRASQLSSNGSAAKMKLSTTTQELSLLVEEQKLRAEELLNEQVLSNEFLERLRQEMTKHLEEFQAQTSETALGEALRSDQMATDWAEKWNATHQHYHEQLRYEAPVKLWEDKGREHRDAAKLAFIWFASLAALTIVAAALIVICFGEWIGASFTTMRCEYGGKCQEIFSFRGPLTIGGILIGASVLIWAMRFSSRIYLSERHLALGAEERKAFTQSYLAMKTDNTVTGEQEAIVMAALFRPSQDGIVKDDDQALDISAASILAKAMAGQRMPG